MQPPEPSRLCCSYDATVEQDKACDDGNFADGAAPLPAMHIQVKRDGEGCGTGGDWSVRLTAERAGDVLPPEAAGEDSVPTAPDRASLVFYLGDERVWQTLQWFLCQAVM